jgi:hypothetical protein
MKLEFKGRLPSKTNPILALGALPYFQDLLLIPPLFSQAFAVNLQLLRYKKNRNKLVRNIILPGHVGIS